MKKTYVLDTTVCLYDPDAIFRLCDNNVVIPMTVIEEMDRFKKELTEFGRNAREFIRIIDRLRLKGALTSGIKLETGGELLVQFFIEEYFTKLPPELRLDHSGSRILSVALELKERLKMPVLFVTKDTNLRIKADAIGLAAMDYQLTTEEVDNILSGSGSGGYIVVNIQNDERPLFHDLLKGFEEYSRLKGYAVNFSIDTTYNEKIAFKFTLSDDSSHVKNDIIRKDFKDYIKKIENGESFDDLPIVASSEEHTMLVTVMTNRINFLQNSYNLARHSSNIYESILKNSLFVQSQPLQTILVQAGGKFDQSCYSAQGASNIISGNYGAINNESCITSIAIGDSFRSKKEQIDLINNFIEILLRYDKKFENVESVIKNVEKVRDELQDEPQPDPGRVGKWLERAKQSIQLGSLAKETVEAAKELFAAFGLN